MHILSQYSSYALDVCAPTTKKQLSSSALFDSWWLKTSILQKKNIHTLKRKKEKYWINSHPILDKTQL
jgi:hypothetical protein